MIFTTYISFTKQIQDNNHILFIPPNNRPMSIKSSHMHSLPVSSFIIPHILSKFDELSSVRKLIHNNLNGYSSNRMISLVNEINEQVNNQPKQIDKMQNQKQIDKCKKDTFMSIYKISLDKKISKKNQEKNKILIIKELQKKNQKIFNTINTNNKTKYFNNLFNSKKKPTSNNPQQISLKHTITQTNSHIQKLQQLNIQQDIYDKQINKMRHQKQLQQQSKSNLSNKDINTIKNKKFNKIKLNFDYDGKIIDVVNHQHNHLVSYAVRSKIGQQTYICNQDTINSHKNIIPTYIQTTQVIDKQQLTQRKRKQRQFRQRQKKTLQQYQKQSIQFSGVTNPVQNIQIIKGVKVIFDNCTRQNKQGINGKDSKDIGEFGHKYQMSKCQYQKLKTTTNLIHVHNTTDISAFSNYCQSVARSTKKQLQKSYNQNQKEKSNSQLRHSITQAMFSGNRFGLLCSQGYNTKKYMTNNSCQSDLSQMKSDIKKSEFSRPISQMNNKQIIKMDREDNFSYTKGQTQCISGIKKRFQNNKYVIFKKKQDNHTKHWMPKLREKVKQGFLCRRLGYKKFQNTLRIQD